MARHLGPFTTGVNVSCYCFPSREEQDAAVTDRGEDYLELENVQVNTSSSFDHQKSLSFRINLMQILFRLMHFANPIKHCSQELRGARKGGVILFSQRKTHTQRYLH